MRGESAAIYNTRHGIVQRLEALLEHLGIYKTISTFNPFACNKMCAVPDVLSFDLDEKGFAFEGVRGRGHGEVC